MLVLMSHSCPIFLMRCRILSKATSSIFPFRFTTRMSSVSLLSVVATVETGVAAVSVAVTETRLSFIFLITIYVWGLSLTRFYTFAHFTSLRNADFINSSFSSLFYLMAFLYIFRFCYKFP